VRRQAGRQHLENAMNPIVAALLLGATGCALTNTTVTPPTTSVSTGLSGGERRTVQLASPFADERPTRNRCGMKKNAYNMETADVLCSAEPAQWLAERFAAELEAAGFTLTTSPSSPVAVRIEGHLRQFFVEPEVGWVTFNPEADIHVHLVATSESGLVAERDFYVKGVKTALAATDSSYQAAANEAVRLILKDMVSAVLALMNRFPRLGAAEKVPGT
jgi:uncharacterized lipoprotein YajG